MDSFWKQSVWDSLSVRDAQEVLADRLVLENTVEIWSSLLHLSLELDLEVLVSQKSGSDGVVHLILSELMDTYEMFTVCIAKLLENRVEENDLLVFGCLVMIGLGYQSWWLVCGHLQCF